MLRCINKSLLALAAMVYLFMSILLDSDRNFIPFYLASPVRYHIFLEELKTFDGPSFPSVEWFYAKLGVSQEKDKARETVAHILSEQMTDWSKSDIRALSDKILQLSNRYSFDPLLVLSLIEVESRFRPNAVSNHGAMGLMQIKLDTAAPIAQQLALKWEGEKSLMNPSMNIEMALSYMHELRQKFKHPKYYLAAYNMGPNRINKMLREGTPVSNTYYNKVMRSYHRYSDTGIIGRY